MLLFTFPEQGQLFTIPIGDFHLFAFRIVLPVTFLLLLAYGDIKLTGRFGQWFLILLLVWIAYAVISLLWARSISWALFDIAYLAVALMTFVTISSLYVALNDRHTPLARGWLTAFLVLIPIAVWEIVTGDHLEGKWLEHSQVEFIDHPNRFMPATTFGNPNDYTSFLVMTMPLALIVFRYRYQVLSWCFVLAAIVMSYFASSRMALLTLCLQMVTVIVIALLKRSLLPRSYLLGGAASLVLLVAVIWFIKADKGTGPERPAEERSEGIRLSLIRSGWHFFTESRGLGIGAGNFETYLEETETPYPKPHVRNPHNWYMEILSEYGVLIFLGVALFMAALGIKSIAGLLRTADPATLVTAMFCVLTVASYLIICCLSSTFMNKLFNWIPLTALIIGCDQLRKRMHVT